jgi:hypothetical protein
MRLGGEVRTFFIPGTPYDNEALLWVAKTNLGSDDNNSLTLYAEKDNFSQAQFDLFCDITIEAWAKAEARWQAMYGGPLTFESEASAPSNYRSQRARNLYRPTY